MQIMRHCQISYKSALFLMHRVRFAMTPNAPAGEKLTGTVECDETYVGGKPRLPNKVTGKKRGRGCDKPAVFAMVARDGCVRAQVMADVNGKNLKTAMREHIDPLARMVTDQLNPYVHANQELNFQGGHESVNHSAGEYVRGDVHTNTVEGFFSLLKRGIIGTFHAVSREHLHRYVGEFVFRYNTRKNNDGERVILAVQAAEGKRLMYRTPA